MSEEVLVLKLKYLITQTTFRLIVNTFFGHHFPLRTAQLKSADSGKNSVCCKVSKLADLPSVLAHFSTMPRGKQLDVVEKTKILAWFREGVATKEIASRLRRDASVVRKTIRENKVLPPSAAPPPPKKR